MEFDIGKGIELASCPEYFASIACRLALRVAIISSTGGGVGGISNSISGAGSSLKRGSSFCTNFSGFARAGGGLILRITSEHMRI